MFEVIDFLLGSKTQDIVIKKINIINRYLLRIGNLDIDLS